MKNILIILISILCSCNWAKQKTKDTVNKTGEVAGKAGSEFVDGVSKGVEKSFQNEVVLSTQLKEKGIETGKISIHSTDSSSDNVLSTYLIFKKDFNQDIQVKVFNELGQEYGRQTKNIQGLAGEAKYFDFVFDKRTNIDGKGKILFE